MNLYVEIIRGRCFSLMTAVLIKQNKRESKALLTLHRELVQQGCDKRWLTSVASYQSSEAPKQE